MPRILEIRVGAAGDALDRFEAAWNRLAEGRAVAPLHVLTMDDLPALVRTLSPARFALLRTLHAAGPLTIYELAKRLGRNYKNVHGDATQLAALGLIERDAGGAVRVPWDVLRAQLEFGL